MVEDAVETALKTDRAVMGGERTTTATPAMAVAGAPGVVEPVEPVEPVKPVETVETAEAAAVGGEIGETIVMGGTATLCRRSILSMAPAKVPRGGTRGAFPGRGGWGVGWRGEMAIAAASLRLRLRPHPPRFVARRGPRPVGAWGVAAVSAQVAAEASTGTGAGTGMAATGANTGFPDTVMDTGAGTEAGCALRMAVV